MTGRNSQNSQSRSAVGQRGERDAADFLRAKGYAIAAMNWSCPAGEIDIIAKDGETWVFAEVKTRTTAAANTPFESIGPRKRERIMRAVNSFLIQNQLEDALWRIDAIAVIARRGQPSQIEHVENAFDW